MNKSDIEALLSESQNHPFKVGDKVFIRTLTMYHLGRISAIGSGFLTLEDASWVQDTGERLYKFLQGGVTNSAEIEPSGTTHVNLRNVIDIMEWKHELPKEPI